MLNQLLIVQEQNGREKRNTLVSTHEQNYYDLITTKMATTILRPHLLLYIKNPTYIGSIKVAYARAQLLIIHQVKVESFSAIGNVPRYDNFATDTTQATPIHIFLISHSLDQRMNLIPNYQADKHAITLLKSGLGMIQRLHTKESK